MSDDDDEVVTSFDDARRKQGHDKTMAQMKPAHDAISHSSSIRPQRVDYLIGMLGLKKTKHDSDADFALSQKVLLAINDALIEDEPPFMLSVNIGWFIRAYCLAYAQGKRYSENWRHAAMVMDEANEKFDDLSSPEPEQLKVLFEVSDSVHSELTQIANGILLYNKDNTPEGNVYLQLCQAIRLVAAQNQTVE